MLVAPSRLGGIEEIKSGLRWDAAAPVQWAPAPQFFHSSLLDGLPSRSQGPNSARHAATWRISKKHGNDLVNMGGYQTRLSSEPQRGIFGVFEGVNACRGRQPGV
jgi:hypothetical protein